MKKFLFASAMAVATLAAAPAFAGNGYLGATAAHTEAEIGSLDGDGKSLNIGGAGVTSLGERLGLQFDGGVTFHDSDDLSDDTAFNGGLHLFHQKEGGRFGGFVGASTIDDVNTWDVGLEGQMFYGNVILNGAVGYFDIDDLDLDGWGGRVGADYFPQDNFSLSGNFGIGAADAGSNDLDAWSLSARGEYQFVGSPFSVSGGYEHSRIDDFDLEIDTISLGVNYNFGGGTLKDRATTGAGLGGLGLSSLFSF